jgi:hypothetical protein
VLVAGGIAAGLHGILQGVMVRKAGVARVFYPVSAVSVAAAVALLLVPQGREHAMILIYAGSQAATLLVFIIVNPGVLPLFRMPSGSGRLLSSMNGSSEALLFGIVNALALLIGFFFRQIWSERVDPGIAQAAFFGVRLSEIYLGILFTVVANSRFLERVGPERAIPVSRLAQSGLALVALATIAFVLVLIGSPMRVVVPLLLLCMAFQLLCEPLRITSSLGMLFELQHGTALRYALVAVPPVAIAAGLGLWSADIMPIGSFYLFQITAALFQVLAVLIVRAQLEKRRPAIS